jgi:hypothetical protein
VVPLNVEPALGANVATLTELLLRHVPALRTRLGCTSWVHFNEPNTSFSGFVFQHDQKPAPGGVADGTGQLVVFEHVSDAQLHHTDRPVLADQLVAHLMVVLLSKVTNTNVRSCQNQLSFLKIATLA